MLNDVACDNDVELAKARRQAVGCMCVANRERGNVRLKTVKLTLIGRESDRQVVEYLVTYLIREIERLADEEYEKHKRTAGLFLGLGPAKPADKRLFAACLSTSRRFVSIPKMAELIGLSDLETLPDHPFDLGGRQAEGVEAVLARQRECLEHLCAEDHLRGIADNNRSVGDVVAHH